MTIPNLPARGDDWESWGVAVDAEARKVSSKLDTTTASTTYATQTELNLKRAKIEPVNALADISESVTLPDVTIAQLHRLAVVGTFVATPVNAAFSTATTGGSLAPGTFSYRVSATNSFGETLASTATTQVIAAALAAPVLAAPTTATTGGTLAAATYYYKATAINAIGETVGSAEVNIATTGSTSTVGLSWAAITGATGYKIYRATTAGGQSTSPALLASLGTVTTYTDTGAAVEAGAVPASNTTATTTNTVTVNWTATSGATGYKIYGRTGGSEQLIAAVGTVTSYVDTGSVTPAGALPGANTTSPAVPVTLPPAAVGKTLTVEVVQDAVGRRPVTFTPAGTDSIIWRSGSTPSLTRPSARYSVELVCLLAGQWLGSADVFTDLVAGDNIAITSSDDSTTIAAVIPVHSVRKEKIGEQAIAAFASVEITYSGTTFAYGTKVSASPANGLKATVAGLYFVIVETYFQGGAAAERNVSIRVNGTAARENGLAAAGRLGSSGVLALAANDVVTATAYVAANDVLIQSYAPKDTGITMTYLGPLA